MTFTRINVTFPGKRIAPRLVGHGCPRQEIGGGFLLPLSGGRGNSPEMESQTDLIAKITTPATPPENAPALAVKENELLAGESASVATPPAVLEVGEADLLGGNPGTPAPPPPTPGTPAGDASPKRGRGRPPGSKTKKPRRNPDGSFATSDAVDAQPGEATPESETVSQVPNIGDLQAAADVVTVDYQLMAEATFDMSAGILATTLGPEWNPRNPEERDMICKPLATYYKSKGVQDLPPGLMLTIVVCAYAAPRLREPSTASKLRIFWAWLKERVRRKP